MTYDYDIANRLTGVTYPDAKKITYGYDRVTGLMSQVNGVATATLGYNEANLVEDFIANGKLSERYTYHDLTLLPQDHVIDFSGRNITSTSLDRYDASDRLLEMTHINLRGQLAHSYSYDLRGQLRQHKLVAGFGSLSKDASYGYNAHGDMLTKAGETITINDTSIRSAEGVYEIGAFGRMASSPEVKSFEWDALGRLQTADKRSGSVVSYVYQPSDAQRFRVTEMSGSTVTSDKVYMNQYFVIDLANGESQQYYYAGEKRFAEHTAGRLQYMVQDYLKSETYVLNEDGEIVSMTLSNPYGSELYAEGDNSKRNHGFTDGMKDSTGLVQMRERYYASGMGRFMSPDPLFLESPETCLDSAIECSGFGYARNNPMRFTDPTGTCGLDLGATSCQTELQNSGMNQKMTSTLSEASPEQMQALEKGAKIGLATTAAIPLAAAAPAIGPAVSGTVGKVTLNVSARVMTQAPILMAKATTAVTTVAMAARRFGNQAMTFGRAMANRTSQALQNAHQKLKEIEVWHSKFGSSFTGNVGGQIADKAIGFGSGVDTPFTVNPNTGAGDFYGSFYEATKFSIDALTEN